MYIQPWILADLDVLVVHILMEEVQAMSSCRICKRKYRLKDEHVDMYLSIHAAIKCDRGMTGVGWDLAEETFS